MGVPIGTTFTTPNYETTLKKKQEDETTTNVNSAPVDSTAANDSGVPCVEYSTSVAPTDSGAAEETTKKSSEQIDTARPTAQAPTGDWNASLSDLKAQLAQKEAEIDRLRENAISDKLAAGADTIISPPEPPEEITFYIVKMPGESDKDFQKRQEELKKRQDAENEKAWENFRKDSAKYKQERKLRERIYDAKIYNINSKLATDTAKLEGEIARLKEIIATLEAQGANSASPSPTNEPTSTSTWEIKNGVNMFGPSNLPEIEF